MEANKCPPIKIRQTVFLKSLQDIMRTEHCMWDIRLFSLFIRAKSLPYQKCITI